MNNNIGYTDIYYCTITITAYYNSVTRTLLNIIIMTKLMRAAVTVVAILAFDLTTPSVAA